MKTAYIVMMTLMALILMHYGYTFCMGEQFWPVMGYLGSAVPLLISMFFFLAGRLWETLS